jgi:hypothetical protein
MHKQLNILCVCIYQFFDFAFVLEYNTNFQLKAGVYFAYSV